MHVTPRAFGGSRKTKKHRNNQRIFLATFLAYLEFPRIKMNLIKPWIRYYTERRRDRQDAREGGIGKMLD